MSKLAAQVAARNLVNEYATELTKQLLETFKPFVGKKIVKADHGLIKKIILPATPEGNVRYHRLSQAYDLIFSVTAWASRGDHGAAYAETGIHLGHINQATGELMNLLEEIPERRTNYTVEEIAAKQKVVEEKKQEWRDAQADLFPFDEY